MNTNMVLKTAGELERLLEWREWMEKIPSIQFPPHWFVTIIPPFVAAMVRFRVQTKREKSNYVSVYLDCHEVLGSFGGPYWEIHPSASEDDSVERFALNDVEGLLKGIEKSLRKFEY